MTSVISRACLSLCLISSYLQTWSFSSRVHLNRGINRVVKDATGINPRIKPNSRPDVAVTFKDKKINQVEVRSKTDKPRDLKARMDATKDKLPKEMRGINRVVDASKDMK